MNEKYDWNQNNMFFLTRDHPVSINVIGDGYSDNVPVNAPGSLLYYGNQVLVGEVNQTDEFGRNAIDRAFIKLCTLCHLFLIRKGYTFQHLTVEKEGDEFIVEFNYNRNYSIKMELTEILEHITELINEN